MSTQPVIPKFSDLTSEQKTKIENFKRENWSHKAAELLKYEGDKDLIKMTDLFESVGLLVRSASNNLKKEKETVEYWKEQSERETRWVSEGPISTNMLSLQSNYRPDKNYTSKYFEEKTIQLEKRMTEIYQAIEDINNVISRNEQNTSINELNQTLKLQSDMIFYLANVISELHETMNDLREEYVEKEGKGFDVFKEIEKIEETNGMEEFNTGIPGIKDIPMPQQQQNQQKDSGFNFGGSSGGSSSSGFNFGGSSDTSSGGFNFGSSNSSTSGNSGFNFDSGSSGGSSGGFNFGGDSGGFKF